MILIYKHCAHHAVTHAHSFLAPEIMAPTTIKEAFNLPMGAKDIMGLAKQFDFSKLSEIRKDSKVLPFTCDLAPSFGTLDKESVRLMDDSLKVLISGTTRVIAGLTDKSWNSVVATLAQNSLIEQMGDETFRSDELRKEDANYFKVDGSPDHRVVQEARDWFNRLIAGTTNAMDIVNRFELILIR